jgi:hypothetical protein
MNKSSLISLKKLPISREDIKFMKHCLLFCSAVLVLTACSVLDAEPTATITPETVPGPATQMITTEPSSTPITIQPTESYDGWKTLDQGTYSIKCPSSFYIPPSTDPVLYIGDTKATFDAWRQTNSIADNGLLIQLIALNLDRRLDPYKDPSLLATPEQALQREINRAIGIPYYVSGSTNVPWENANGGINDGRKVFYPTISHQNIMLGTTNAAKIISNKLIYYFILNPNDDSYYVRIIVEPASSTMIKVADQILASFTFDH